MITLTEDKIRIVQYQKICKVLAQEIHIAMKHSMVIITGEQLFIVYLNADEIILNGNIRKVDFLSHEGA